ncbi:MAG TPA: hypothetical protein VIF62_18485 [Labilithrix sp.]|jgi:hypothetical protein
MDAKLLGAALVVLGGCHSSDDTTGPPSASIRFATVSLGDTCGVRETETGTPTQYDCGDGAKCGVTKDGIPHGSTHNTYGICIEACADAAPPCGAGYGCSVSAKSCLRTCMHDVDCPAPYQTCAAGFCGLRECLIDDDCGGGVATKCTDGICTH